MADEATSKDVPRYIVFRGVDSKAFEGVWIETPGEWEPMPLPGGAASNTPNITVVPTGAYEVRADGERAEVYRPEGGLLELRVILNSTSRQAWIEAEVSRALDLSLGSVTIARTDGTVINFDPVIHDGHAPEGHKPRYEPAPAYWEEDEPIEVEVPLGEGDPVEDMAKAMLHPPDDAQVASKVLKRYAEHQSAKSA